MWTSSGSWIRDMAPTTSDAGTANLRTQGVCVHKATHHFDVINWWINDEPETVFGFGERRFYGPQREARGERCSGSYATDCEFFVDYAADPLYKMLYFDAEHVDGYRRDGCVVSPEIDIYDTMSVAVRYRSRRHAELFAHRPQSL